MRYAWRCLQAILSLGNHGAGNKVTSLAQATLWPLRSILAARGRLFPWVPVFIGTGVGLWFALPWEPGAAFYLFVMAALAFATILSLRGPELTQGPSIAVVCLLMGMAAAGLRAHSVSSPMLDFRYYGPIIGRIIEIDRSQTDALRLTLDTVVLEDTPPDRTPRHVRVSLQGDWPVPKLEPGQTVMTTGHLTGPPGAAEPGAFDFRRMAFFDQLGGVGYTRTPVLLWAGPVGQAQIVGRWRTQLSNAIMEALPGDSGAFASGVMTGDRSGLSLDAVAALRDSSLAHLLAISGMNMAFLTAFVFGLFRYGIALVPPLALRVNAKKLAAVIAFAVAFWYLLLSGANVATERAFIMVSVMLGAVLLDRRALTLRSVAISAILILLWQPESLLEPGFQMSYAATVALIVGFGAVDAGVMRKRWPRWMMPLFTLVLSSLLGGFATAPYAAAHFNRFAEYGLVANLLTVPVMGTIVMPAGAIAALLAPVGLAGPALWVMDMGSRWILFVAHWVAGWEGAVTSIPAPGAWVLPMITLGGLWVIIWQGRARWAGAGVVVLAIGLWVVSDRPVLLIDETGALAGLMAPDGRSLSAAKGAGFAAKSWLENDGDLAGQEGAAARTGFVGPKGARVFEVGGRSGIVLSGKGATDKAQAACDKFDLVIVAAPVDVPAGVCLLLDQDTLAQTGTIAIWTDDKNAMHLQWAHQVQRLWSPDFADPTAPIADSVGPALAAFQ